jgi:branched-chain amino acid transport system ATP-binding protein
MTAPRLSCRQVYAGYGKLTVVRRFDLEADAGSVIAVLGPNGAGKTTSMLAIAGLLNRTAGEVLVDGRPLPNGRAAAVNRAGVILVPDDRSLFTTLTVKENVAAAARKGSMSEEEVQKLFPPLQSRWNTKAGTLSGGEQQMLAMARAMVQRPKVLVVDEMSMGLAPITVENLLPVVRDIADRTGAVVVLVEQHIHLALEVADQVIVLVHGEIALNGEAKEFASDPSKLEAAYLGMVPASPVAG